MKIPALPKPIGTYKLTCGYLYIRPGLRYCVNVVSPLKLLYLKAVRTPEFHPEPRNIKRENVSQKVKADHSNE
jgi:hypothetical protein